MKDRLVRFLGWHGTVLSEDPCVTARWRWLRGQLKPGPLRTLDAGCGLGTFTMYVARMGNDAVGISLDERSLETARSRAALLGLSNARFLRADLRELDRLADRLGTFEQILCLETLEHIRDDRKLVSDLAALLDPGGRLILTTPSERHRPLRGDRISESEDGGHVRFGYSHDELSNLCRECALDVIVEDYLCGFVSQKLTNLMRRLALRSVRLAWASTFPLRIFQIMDRPLTAAIGYPYLCIGIVAVKRGSGSPVRGE